MIYKKVTNDEIRQAFSKLQSNVYFDNYDLVLRGRVALFKRRLTFNIDNFLKECVSDRPFARFLGNKMKLSFFPKKVEPKENKFPSNYYTNTESILGNKISRPNVHCDFPVELHLVATIWLMRYGPYLEGLMPNTSYGNRLAINENTQRVEGRSLFKPYFKQFQNWWSLAINTTKKNLTQQQSVTILNFDLKSFYHDVKFDFDKLENVLVKQFPRIKNDVIHSALRNIHISYRSLLRTVKPDLKINESIFPLPIGLFTSHIFANYHLLGLDRFVKRKCDPLYYGRYVDDVLIVIKNTVLEEEDIKSKIQNVGNTEIVRLYLKNYFSKLFIVPDDSSPIRFKISSLKDLKLNMDKLFIYQFDQEHTPNLIDKFVEEQKERSSMFRFLSDEEDEAFDDFENHTFESNFDHVDLNKARFKNFEDNKYKLSTFLSKLIKRRIQRGEGYKEDEIGKIKKYFRGGYLIKHYYFWEKLFTLLVAYKKMNELAELVNEIDKEINSLETYISLGHDQEFLVTKDEYQKSLDLHLRYALAMALGLDINMLVKNKRLIKILSKRLSTGEQKVAKTFDSMADYLEIKNSLFKNTGLIRGAFVYYPLMQFTEFALEYNIDLTSPDSIFEVLTIEVTNYEKLFAIQEKEFVPFRVKFWQVALLAYCKNLFTCKVQPGKMWFTDRFSSNEILNQAFEEFYDINKPNVPKTDLLNAYFQSTKTDVKEESGKIVIPKERSSNFYIQELRIPNGGVSQEKYRIAIINKYVDSADFLASLDGNPIKDPAKDEVFDRILDEIVQIDKCDLFVMPELSLPHKLVSKFTDQAARNQIGFISGIEHLNIQNIGFNFIITVLPINIEGDKDAIPVFRLKNHYAPIEEECIWDEKIRGRKMTVPKPTPYRYDLFEWRGFYFSSYYCYELADVFHRSIFFSKVDAVIAPVWNMDTHYYNSIIDAATRDMHNYFIIVNTAQYGFSKISRPQDHINKEKVIVKGGTEKGYDFTVLVGDLKVKELREFQKLDYQQQKQAKRENTHIKFKATPPDFPKENVIIRENNASYYM